MEKFGIFSAAFVRRRGGKWETGWYINPKDERALPMLITPDGEIVVTIWDLSIDWDERARQPSPPFIFHFNTLKREAAGRLRAKRPELPIGTAYAIFLLNPAALHLNSFLPKIYFQSICHENFRSHHQYISPYLSKLQLITHKLYSNKSIIQRTSKHRSEFS